MPLLPRFRRSMQALEDERKIGRILLESEAEAHPDANGRVHRRSADGHNRERARGSTDHRPCRRRRRVARDRSGARPAREGVATAVAVRHSRSVDVECGECGATFELSVRREYQYRAEGREPRCSTCRRPRVEMTPAERERYVRWWREQSGLDADELREIAVGLGSLSA